jgi:hypothetical protein
MSVKLTLIMIYFADANTKCQLFGEHDCPHFVFVLAKLIIIKVNLTDWPLERTVGGGWSGNIRAALAVKPTAPTPERSRNCSGTAPATSS